MKTLTQKINWYCQYEDRRWKKVSNFIELFIISTSSLVLITIIQLYGNGKHLQMAVVLFNIGIFVSASLLAPVVYKSLVLKRWHTSVVTLGLGCGAGMATLCTLLLLELQLAGIT